MSIKIKLNNDWVDTNIQAVRGVNHVNSEDVYTKEETEKKFATKTEVQTQINNSVTKENIENTIEAWLEEDNESTNGEVYTKQESDALFSGKVSKSDIVQSTGTSTTAVMSQKAVSDEMANKLNKKVTKGWQVVTTEVKTGVLISSMDFTQYSSRGYCNTFFDVHEGEKYHIKGYSVNTVYCGLFYEPTQRIITEVGAFDTEVVVPSGVTKIGVNAKMTGTGSLLIEKWVSGYQASEEFYQEIATLKNSVDANTSAINGVKQSVYTFVEPTTFEDGKYINLSRQETSSASSNYAKYQVQGGDKYRIRGWNINANIPLAFVYSMALGSARLIYGGSSTYMCDEAVIPQGYDTLYVNGKTAQKAIIHKITEEIISDTISKEEICVMPFADSVGLSCVIARRMDNTNDGMIMFGHRTSHPNKFFDYNGISFSPRGEKGINNIRPYSMQYATLTDYIMPIVVAAVNNADGDFPTNTSYFTGGFHAYGNATAGDITATMRQISQSIRVDGKEVVGTDAFVYGHKCEIDVVNHLQGCNTEKADGTGREILRQNIHIYADKSQVKVKVEFVALEDVNVYQMDGIGQYLPFDSFRLIGSKSKKGVYTKGTLTRPNDDDRAICAIRSFDDAHYLECGINPYYAEGDCKYNNVKYNAQATTANKGYFHLIAGNAVTLAQNEMLSFEGYFDFGVIK